MITEEVSKFEFEKILNRLSGNQDDKDMFSKLLQEHYTLIQHLKTTKLHDVLLFEEASSKYVKDSLSYLYDENNKLKQEINELRKIKGKCEKYKKE